LPGDRALSDAVTFFGRIVGHGAWSLKFIAMGLVCGEPLSPVTFILATASIYFMRFEGKTVDRAKN